MAEMADYKPFPCPDENQKQVDIYSLLNFMAAEKHLKSLRVEDPNPMNSIVMPDPSVLSSDHRGPLPYDRALEMQFRTSLFPTQPHTNVELYQRLFFRSLDTLRLMQDRQKFAEALDKCAATGDQVSQKLPELLVPRKSEVLRMEAAANELADNSEKFAAAQRKKMKALSKLRKAAIEDSQESQSSRYVYAPVAARGIRKPGPKPDKNFTCVLCKRSFGYKHVLQNHLRTHTGEKPYGCTVCDKRFTRDHHLKTHFRLHTGERPHKCEYCDRKFVQVANLRRHHRVHTGEKPYKCIDCESAFPDKNQLRTHAATHEPMNTCHTCRTIFRCKNDFLIHTCQGEPSEPLSMSETDYKYATDDLLPRTKFTNSNLEEFTGRSRTASPESSADSSDSQMPSSPMEGVSAPQLSPKDVVPVQTEPEDLSLNSSPTYE